MDTREFNALINGLPKVRKQIGVMADGTPLTIEVPSLFPPEEAPDAS